MEFNKSVSNPMLIGAIELMKAEPNAEHNTMLVNEIIKAKLFSPATIDPQPQVDEEGNLKIENGSRIHFSMLTTPDAQAFIPAFTDQAEVDKWQEKITNEDVQIHLAAMTFDDYMNMLFNKATEASEKVTAGIVINPFGANLVLNRDNMKAMYMAREATRKKKAQQEPQ